MIVLDYLYSFYIVTLFFTSVIFDKIKKMFSFFMITVMIH